MPRFAANLSMMFTEVPFLERFERAATAGFTAVEYLFPYEFEAAVLAERLRRADLSQVLFNLPPGDWSRGERGLAALAGREDEFKRALDEAVRYAGIIGCPRLHVMAGLVPDEEAKAAAMDTYLKNLEWACTQVAGEPLTLVIEPINNRDIPGYLLNYQYLAREVIEQVGHTNLRLQLDLYHVQIMEGDLAVHVRDYADITAHMQIAGVPERHEPDTGEINYPYLFELIDEVGYDGWVGCEYRPRGHTEAGLDWFAPYAVEEQRAQGNL
ncbi:MAG: TIM barrel protein [Gammaproteobacteria bacterium]|nr:TIM barrel protein [Gammaproteobacteria bacterium]